MLFHLKVEDHYVNFFIGKFQMQVLPQCGHAVHEDAPEKVSKHFCSAGLTSGDMYCVFGFVEAVLLHPVLGVPQTVHILLETGREDKKRDLSGRELRGRKNVDSGGLQGPGRETLLYSTFMSHHFLRPVSFMDTVSEAFLKCFCLHSISFISVLKHKTIASLSLRLDGNLDKTNWAKFGIEGPNRPCCISRPQLYI